MNKEVIILTVPFWDVEDQTERSNNIGYCLTSMEKYVAWHNSRSTKFDIEIMVANLGENINPSYPLEMHLPHHDLKYKFEKPTRLNSLFLELYSQGYNYVGMCDPDLILFEHDYQKVFDSIEFNFSSENMITYGFARTKPELRTHVYDEYKYTQSQHIHNHPLIKEAKEHAEYWGVCGGCFFMGLETWVGVGGFNEDYRVYGFDDVDFTQRFRLMGYEVIINSAIFYHLWHPTVISTATEEELIRYEYELKYWRLHREFYKVEMDKDKDFNLLKHITPSLIDIHPCPETLQPSTFEFSYDHGRHPIDSFPMAFKRQMEIVPNDKVFYTIN